MPSLSSPTSPSSSSCAVHPHRLQREHHQRTGKSKSISSLPAPGSHRNLHRLIISPHVEVDHDPIASTSCPPYKSTYTPASTLSRSSSLRSRHKTVSSSAANAANGAMSPSRLPATNAVSYFPPFEDMGSPALSPGKNASVSTDTESSHPRYDGLPKAGESSRSGFQPEQSYTYRAHGKGRSLGSLAGFMSASISWGFSSISCASPSTPPFTTMSRSASMHDDVAVQALSKQFTPGKRRVLESFTVTGEGDLQEGTSATGTVTRISTHKRRMRSEVEVDAMILEGRDSLSRTSKDQARGSLVDDEEIVEDMVNTQSSSIPRTRPSCRTRPRPPLKLLLPTLPNWRFPLGPSPPVTCLSPDIPLEAFHITIDNPCQQVSPRHQQPAAKGMSSSQQEIEEDLEEIDSHLHLGRRRSRTESQSLTPSPTTSSTSTFESQPSTPLKSSCIDYRVDIKRHSPLALSQPLDEIDGTEKVEDGNLKLNLNRDMGLERTCSRFSERSCETVKQQVWGRNDEITPKAARVRRLTSSSCSQ